jgi:hypothetical protein
VIALLIVIAGCKPAEEPVCDATIGEATPADGAGPLARDTVLHVPFTGTAAGATIHVTDADGGVVAGDIAIADGEATFTAQGGALPADAQLSWTADICSSHAEGSFSTGTLETTQDASTLPGKTYAVDLGAATWVSPPGAGDLIGQVFAGAFLIGVTAATDTELTCISAAGEATDGGSWQQDPCYETIDLDHVDFSNNPYFSLHADRMQFTVAAMDVLLHDFTLTGGLTDEAIVDGTFAGEVDFRDYSGIDCNTVEAFLGTSCTACASDGETFCLDLVAEDVAGPRVQGLTLVPNTDPAECDATDTAH